MTEQKSERGFVPNNYVLHVHDGYVYAYTATPDGLAVYRADERGAQTVKERDLVELASRFNWSRMERIEQTVDDEGGVERNAYVAALATLVSKGAAPVERRVSIHGPNLADQSKGTFVIHAADCADNARVRYLGGVEGEEGRPWTVEVASKTDVTYAVYSDQIHEGCPYQAARDDLHFAPCCADLAEGEGEDK